MPYSLLPTSPLIIGFLPLRLQNPILFIIVFISHLALAIGLSLVLILIKSSITLAY